MGDFAFLLALSRRHAGWMLLGFLLAVTSIASAVALTTAAGWYVAALGAGGVVLVTGAAGTVLRIAAATRTISRYLERIATHEATFRILADIRVWFFRGAIPLAPLRLGGYRSGDLLSRAIGDIEALDGLYVRLLVPIGVAMVVTVGVAVFLAGISVPVLIAALVPITATALVLPRIAGRLSEAPGRASVEAQSRLRVDVVDLVQGLPELLAYDATGRRIELIARANDDLIAAQDRRALVAAGTETALVLLTNLAIVATLLVGAATGLSGPILAPAVFCVMAAFEAIGPLPVAVQQLGQARAAARRLIEIADSPAPIVEPTVSEAPANDAMRFEDVRFAYPGTEAAALDGFDLDVPAGTKVALVGSSGAGKSTVLLLAQRFADPDSGTVTLGGVTMSRIASDVVRGRVGLMSQRARIFAGSLRENLLLGDPSADDARLLEALRAAGLQGFLDRLTDGLDTWLGENGVTVSGGEARRVALARVYLRDPPILLLDEPTEGLDPTTERDVIERLKTVTRDKTVILVTHRETGLDLVDTVVHLSKGRVAGNGSTGGPVAG